MDIVQLVDHLGSDLTVVNAARVSFHKHATELTDKDEKLIKYLAEHNHWTPFSHAVVNLRVKAPIFVARQLFKHKVGITENEVSRRYVSDEPEFYHPTVWRKAAANKKQGSHETEIVTEISRSAQRIIDNQISEVIELKNIHTSYEIALRHCQKLYEEMIASGVAPEQARMVLPQSMFTEWYWTGSLYAFARVCNLRLDSHAQSETREYGQAIYNLLSEKYPISMKYLVKATKEQDAAN